MKCVCAPMKGDHQDRELTYTDNCASNGPFKLHYCSTVAVELNFNFDLDQTSHSFSLPNKVALIES